MICSYSKHRCKCSGLVYEGEDRSLIKVLKVLGLGLRIHRAGFWAELTFDTALSTRMPSAAIPVLTTIPAVEFSKAFPAFENAFSFHVEMLFLCACYEYYCCDWYIVTISHNQLQPSSSGPSGQTQQQRLFSDRTFTLELQPISPQALNGPNH